MADGVRDPGFLHLVSRIDTGPVHLGNQVEIFFEGEHAFASICEAIQSARREILFETYILRDDATGTRIKELLTAAAARGVTVRLLADAFGSSGTRDAFWRDLRARGIHARLFHPFWSRPWDHLYRDHRKIIVVDQRTAFAGGMNVADEYGSGKRARGGPWRDSHGRFVGPVAWEMAVVFREGWVRAGGGHFAVRPWQADDPSGARCVVLDSRPGRGRIEEAAILAALMAACRKRLCLTNAYFAPKHLAVRVLCETARRGVDVRLLLPGSSDVPIVRHAGHGLYAELLRHGVRIFEYQPAVLHAKTLVVDDYLSVVGSSNMDFRSFDFNAECNVLIFDEPTATRLAGAFETDLARSNEIKLDEWQRRPFLHKCLDSLANRFSPLL